MVLATEAFEDALDSWPSSTSSELSFATSSSSFHCCFNKATKADLPRPSKANFFFFVLAEYITGLIVDVVTGVDAIG